MVSRRLSRQPFVNRADGMLQPPRVAQIGEDAAAAGGEVLLAADRRLITGRRGRQADDAKERRIVAEYLHEAG